MIPTKGAWHVDGPQKVTVNAYHPDHPNGFVTILACPGGGRHATLTEIQANAALISAAPELLTALEAFLGAYYPEDDAPMTFENLDDAAEFARDVIAKAKGE